MDKKIFKHARCSWIWQTCFFCRMQSYLHWDKTTRNILILTQTPRLRSFPEKRLDCALTKLATRSTDKENPMPLPLSRGEAESWRNRILQLVRTRCLIFLELETAANISHDHCKANPSNSSNHYSPCPHSTTAHKKYISCMRSTRGSSMYATHS